MKWIFYYTAGLLHPSQSHCTSGQSTHLQLSTKGYYFNSMDSLGDHQSLRFLSVCRKFWFFSCLKWEDRLNFGKCIVKCLQGARIHAGNKLQGTVLKETDWPSLCRRNRKQKRKDNPWLLLAREHEFSSLFYNNLLNNWVFSKNERYMFPS